jgi:hypothetical protein
MHLRRLSVVIVAALLSSTLPAAPAAAQDSEYGTLSCPAGKIVWIRERTSAGSTMIAWTNRRALFQKPTWSTTQHRTGLRSTWWQVSTTGAMDHKITTAYCGN